MNKVSDFFLCAAGEHQELTSPRACWIIGRLKDNVRDDHMLVEIDPPLIGQRYGLGENDIRTLILSARHQGYTLFPIMEWPSHVYVSRILDKKIQDTGTFSGNQVEVVAWAMIFRTLEDAAAHVRNLS